MPALAISTTFFGHDDVIPWLPLLTRQGIKNIELRGYPPRLDYKNEEYLARLKIELAAQQMTVSSYHLPFHGCYLSAANEEERAAAVATMKASAEAAAFLNARCLVLHPGGEFKSKAAQKIGQTQSQKSILEIYQLTQELGIPLALENMLPGRIGQDCDWLENTLRALGGPLCGICFDTSHANVVGVNLPKVIAQLGAKIINVHFSDNHGESDEHLFPFWGKVPWEKVLKALKQAGYTNPLTLEVHQCDALEAMLTEAVACHKKLQEIWERV